MIHKKRAFSVIEMLVAVSVISLLIFLSLSIYRMQLSFIMTSTSFLSREWEVFKALKECFESMRYYVIYLDDSFIQNPLEQVRFFFDGDVKRVVFVTNNGIINPDKDVLVELRCEKDKLLYREERLFRKMDYLHPNFTNEAKSLVLLSKLKQCNFSYLDRSGNRRSQKKGTLPYLVKFDLELENGRKREYLFLIQTNYYIIEGFIKNILSNE